LLCCILGKTARWAAKITREDTSSSWWDKARVQKRLW